MGTTSESCILIGGYAQPPKETAANFAYNILSCQILINKKSHCIVQCHFNTISPLTSDYINDLLFGYCFDEPLEPILEKIQSHIHLAITSSIVHALRNAQERFRQIDIPA